MLAIADTKQNPCAIPHDIISLIINQGALWHRRDIAECGRISKAWARVSYSLLYSRISLVWLPKYLESPEEYQEYTEGNLNYQIACKDFWGRTRHKRGWFEPLPDEITALAKRSPFDGIHPLGYVKHLIIQSADRPESFLPVMHRLKQLDVELLSLELQGVFIRYKTRTVNVRLELIEALQPLVKHIRSLSLESAAVKTDDMPLFTGLLQQCPRLCSLRLNINKNRLDFEVLKSLAENDPTNIKELNLGFSDGTLFVEAAPVISELNSLKHVSISLFGVTTEWKLFLSNHDDNFPVHPYSSRWDALFLALRGSTNTLNSLDLKMYSDSNFPFLKLLKLLPNLKCLKLGQYHGELPVPVEQDDLPAIEEFGGHLFATQYAQLIARLSGSLRVLKATTSGVYVEDSKLHEVWRVASDTLRNLTDMEISGDILQEDLIELGKMCPQLQRLNVSFQTVDHVLSVEHFRGLEVLSINYIEDDVQPYIDKFIQLLQNQDSKLREIIVSYGTSETHMFARDYFVLNTFGSVRFSSFRRSLTFYIISK